MAMPLQTGVEMVGATKHLQKYGDLRIPAQMWKSIWFMIMKFVLFAHVQLCTVTTY